MRRLYQFCIVSLAAFAFVACTDQIDSEDSPTTDTGSTDSGEPVGDAADSDDSGTTADVGRADADSGADGSDASSNIEATLQLQTAFGGGLEGAEVTYRESSFETDGMGEAVIPVPPNEAFEFRASKSGYWDHVVVGRAGAESFPYITFVASEQTTSTVFNQVGVQIDSDKGIVVVGADTPDLQPLVGAEVTIDRSHDQPITLSGSGADPDNKIEEGEQGFVSFPNVPPGEVSVSIQPPNDETCEIYPGGPPRPDISAGAGDVTVVSFICE